MADKKIIEKIYANVWRYRNRKKIHYALGHFEENKRTRIKQIFPALKKIAAAGIVSIAPIVKMHAQSQAGGQNISLDEVFEKHIDFLDEYIDAVIAFDEQSRRNSSSFADKLWEKMEQHINNLQQRIIQAKKGGYRNRAVRGLFDAVNAGNTISGSANYCVAGAIYSHRLCGDAVMNDILPNPHTPSKPYGGSPNTSCNALLKYFKKNLGENYARRGDKNFSKVIKNLKPGDIIIVYSRVNTSSNKHCVTVASTVKNNKVRVRSFNNERNYSVNVNIIIGAANIMDEYTRRMEKLYGDEKTKVTPVQHQITETTPEKSPPVQQNVRQSQPIIGVRRENQEEITLDELPAFLQRQRGY